MTRKRGTLILLALAAFGAAAAPAHAGSYSVYACGSYDNRSWNSVGAAGISADETLPGQRDDGQRGRRRRARPARRHRLAPPSPRRPG